MSDNVHYDLEMKEQPTCQVHVEFLNAQEADEFFKVIKSFAESHGIPESRGRSVSNRPSPHFRTEPMYYSEQVIISSMAVVAPDDQYGQSSMSVLRRDFPAADFKKMADSFAESFTRVFTNRVRFTFDEGKK